MTFLKLMRFQIYACIEECIPKEKPQGRDSQRSHRTGLGDMRMNVPESSSFVNVVLNLWVQRHA